MARQAICAMLVLFTAGIRSDKWVEARITHVTSIADFRMETRRSLSANLGWWLMNSLTITGLVECCLTVPMVSLVGIFQCRTSPYPFNAAPRTEYGVRIRLRPMMGAMETSNRTVHAPPCGTRWRFTWQIGANS
ncbi:hypothetical protein PCH_Pc20g11720 [Penicillium rubens Wisconsin 54-1255]|uniref:Uncharacterized protein n=1 Tax=Penicillium rubens (strain ATCC 28089 / DSM 1075 / NRRL 1951 / Wisconsin 54-1255) TaxID=500485 RepID=B6HGA6_PENRW|nr:hypothetical protein PCH_Pc20g11720 [Penicillium rubens Wisconsin 54-1255]